MTTNIRSGFKEVVKLADETFTLLTHPTSFASDDIVLNKEIFSGNIQLGDFVRILFTNNVEMYKQQTTPHISLQSPTVNGSDNTNTTSSTLVPFSSASFSSSVSSSETTLPNLSSLNAPLPAATSVLSIQDCNLSTALATQGLIFKVTSMQATGGRLEVSLHKQIADLLNIKPYCRVIIERIQNSYTCQVDFVELTFKKQFLQRGNMWRFKKSMTGRSGESELFHKSNYVFGLTL